jgi:transcriptional regulator NrdR family protein
MIAKQTSKGFECEKCGSRNFKVIYTRSASESKLVRRRECKKCGRRFTTWEKRLGE